MAEISSTRNLETFQRQFDRVGTKHEANAVERNGEMFLVKGRGKSRLGRFWFALSHPKKKSELLSRQNFNVVRTLMKAAKNDVGPFGPVLVKKYLDARGLRGDSALSKADVKDAVKYVKDNIQREKLVFGVKQTLVNAGIKDPVKFLADPRKNQYKILWKNPQTRKLLEFVQIAAGGRKLSNLQILSARVAAEDLVRYLKSDATLVDKQNAFRSFANTYGDFGQEGTLKLEREDVRTKNLVKLAKNANPTLEDMKKEAELIESRLSNVRGPQIVRTLEDLFKGNMEVIKISVDDMDREIEKARKMRDHVSGNKAGLGASVDYAVKTATVKFNMYGERVGELSGEEAYQQLQNNPLFKTGLPSYLKSAGSKAGWHHHASNELGHLLKAFPKGGKTARSALKLFHAKFLGQGAKTRLEIPNNLKTRFENAMNGNTVSKSNLEKLVKDLRKTLDAKTHELVVSELKTDKGQKDFVTALNGRGPNQKHFDGDLNAFEGNLKVLKSLGNKPGIRNHPQLLNLTGSEADEINKLIADKKELLAINKTKEILGARL